MTPDSGLSAGADPNLPGGRVASRTVFAGGRSKVQLLADLADAGVELNEAARILFASDLFTPAEIRREWVILELAVRELGFPQGATMREMCGRLGRLGLRLAPMELGPHLRLQYRDQPEGCWGHPVTEHRAPPGSLTVASDRLSVDDGFPAGFYLRRIQGTLWLRGYWCSEGNVWDPDDRLVFCRV